MTPEPRSEADYSPRQTEAARRVLVDVGQVLASFADCLVVVAAGRRSYCWPRQTSRTWVALMWTSRSLRPS